MASTVPAVAAAMRVLERLAAAAPEPVSAGALAADLTLNRSTCYNILATLQEGGWVNNLGQRAGWTLGPRIAALGVYDEVSVHVAVQDELDRLCRRLGYVVFAAQEDGSGSYTVVAVGDPGRGVRVTVNTGDRFPFSTPGLMYAIWPYKPWEEFLAMAKSRLLERFTEQTTVDLAQIAERFAKVRERGFGHSIKQFNLSQSGASAAVFGPDAKPRLAIVAIAFSSELDWDNLETVGGLVRDAAARITARTGGAVPVNAGVRVAE